MRRFAALVLLMTATACTSPRYIGSIGRDRTFVNRGYGFLVRLDHKNLSERFDAITATNLTAFPAGTRSRLVETPVDMDGDGFLDPTETTRHMEPALRLVSRTSTAVTVDIEVLILGPKDSGKSPRDLLPEGVGAVETRRVAPDFEAQVGVAPQRVVAVIEQPEFRAEERLKRRQIVRVTLRAPRITAALKATHEDVLDALILNRRGSFETTQEQW